MCTSFVKKTGDNFYIAMNFDNNGMSYSIQTGKKDWFIVSITVNKVKYPSFGVHKSGIFFNNLFVDANEKGKYKRGKGVVHTSRFLSDIINEKACADNLEEYLEQTEIVNVPDFSTHNMICGTKGDVWIIEPGRGNIHHTLKNGEFKIMTNASLIDSMKNGEEVSCKRYITGKKLLSNGEDFNLDRAFEILDAVKQTETEWKTEFSMVYDKSAWTIYYCENQDFTNIQKFIFK